MATQNSANNIEIPDSVITEQGDIIYGSGVGVAAVLAHGAAGQLLASGGHGANPSWADAAAAHTSATGATPKVANLVFGTGSPPDPGDVPEGTIWIKYIA